MTSLAFMFVDVPAPPWTGSTTNCSCSRPARISSHAPMIAPAMSGGSRPRSRLACAAACLTAASAAIRSGNRAMVEPVIAKFSTARTVCTP
jgi:hypothetical protein